MRVNGTLHRSKFGLLSLDLAIILWTLRPLWCAVWRCSIDVCVDQWGRDKQMWGVRSLMGTGWRWCFMWVIYLVVVFVVISAHGLLYLLIKAGIEESKKEIPPHVKRRLPREYRARIEMTERFKQEPTDIANLIWQHFFLQSIEWTGISR